MKHEMIGWQHNLWHANAISWSLSSKYAQCLHTAHTQGFSMLSFTVRDL